MNVLVTGGAGFIGSNFVRYALKHHPGWRVINVDALTYAGNLENLSDLSREKRHCFIKADISSATQMETLFKKQKPDVVINFAAESHVDRSLHVGAQAFIQTNVVGTQVLLDLSRKYAVSRYVQISTDEVYGSLGRRGEFTEASPIQPNNPYAATKASADFLVRAAHKSHGLNTVITRCSNNYGPFQFPEKLIPLMIANALEDKPLPVYGDGMHRRDWIYVEDHCSAIDVVLRKGIAGHVYNIGLGEDIPNLDIVKAILRAVDKPESLIRYVEDRPGHDRRYSMGSGLLRRELGWKPTFSFEKGLSATVRWYREHAEWLHNIRTGRYVTYYKALYGRRLAAGKAR